MYRAAFRFIEEFTVKPDAHLEILALLSRTIKKKAILVP
jgi:hypothetical protein